MKRILLLTALVLLPVLACSQNRVDSPQTVTWNGESDLHEIGIQMGLDEIIILGDTADLEYLVDLQGLEIYGSFAILVRGKTFTEPDMWTVSEWLRSDIEGDVITIDGIPQTFKIDSALPAIKPAIIRIR